MTYNYDNRLLLTSHIKAGLPGAYEYLLKLYYPRLHNYALHYLKNEENASDVVQDAMVKLFLGRENITTDDVASLLFSILRNECLNKLKSENVRRNYAALIKDTRDADRLYNTDLLNDTSHKILYEELLEMVDQAIDNMPEQTKTIYKLSRMEGLKNKEIADTMGISIKSVEKHITRANKLLKDRLGEEGYLVFSLLLACLS